jgi:hypothetical protein
MVSLFVSRFCIHNFVIQNKNWKLRVLISDWWPPLWSSGQSYWLQIQGSRIPRLQPYGICHADYMTPLCSKKLVLTSPTSGGRSVGNYCMAFTYEELKKTFKLWKDNQPYLLSTCSTPCEAEELSFTEDSDSWMSAIVPCLIGIMRPWTWGKINSPLMSSHRILLQTLN